MEKTEGLGWNFFASDHKVMNTLRRSISRVDRNSRINVMDLNLFFSPFLLAKRIHRFLFNLRGCT